MADPLSPLQTDDHAAWAQAALRRQVERLDELSELGLSMARAIEAERADGAVTAFSKVAKALRLTALLQSRLIKDIEQVRTRALIYAPRFEEEARLAAARERGRLDPADDHKARVERIVERQVKARHQGDEDTVERLMIEASERLDDEDLYRDVLTRPIGELVACICRDLGVDPDWDRLADEAWAREEGIDPARPPLFAAATGGKSDCQRQSVERPRRGGGGIVSHPPPDQLFGSSHANG